MKEELGELGELFGEPLPRNDERPVFGGGQGRPVAPYNDLEDFEFEQVSASEGLEEPTPEVMDDGLAVASIVVDNEPVMASNQEGGAEQTVELDLSKMVIYSELLNPKYKEY